MSTCSRCGLEQDAEELTLSGTCALPPERIAACRERELANLRSLLRSVTGKLEEALGLIQEEFPSQAAAAIESVLEVLS